MTNSSEINRLDGKCNSAMVNQYTEIKTLITIYIHKQNGTQIILYISIMYTVANNTSQLKTNEYV